MTVEPMFLLAISETTGAKASAFVFAVVITIFGLSKLRVALAGRSDLRSLALGACGAAGIFVCAIGVAEIMLVWYDGFPNASSLDLLTSGLLLLLAAAVLDRWWAVPSPPPMPTPPVPPPAA